MNTTGVVRQLDQLGRIVIPIETRRKLNINVKDSVEIYKDDRSVILKKYNPGCIFCEGITNIRFVKNAKVCNSCYTELSNLL